MPYDPERLGQAETGAAITARTEAADHLWTIEKNGHT
jgi:hypothetical protein